MIAKDARAAEVAQSRQHRPRTRTESSGIPQAYDAIGAFRGDIGQHRVEGHLVAVQIRQERDTHGADRNVLSADRAKKWRKTCAAQRESRAAQKIQLEFHGKSRNPILTWR